MRNTRKRLDVPDLAYRLAMDNDHGHPRRQKSQHDNKHYENEVGRSMYGWLQIWPVIRVLRHLARDPQGPSAWSGNSRCTRKAVPHRGRHPVVSSRGGGRCEAGVIVPLFIYRRKISLG